MATIELQTADKGRTQKRLPKMLNIDMTPMVDLGFLLITFFIFTTTMGEPTTVSLNMPANGEPMEVPASKSLTLLLAEDNSVFVYEGEWDKALLNNSIIKSDYDLSDGFGLLVGEKNKQVRSKNPDNNLTVLIKPLTRSSYGNVIDALDEMLINGIDHYAVVEPSAEEAAWVGRRTGRTDEQKNR